MRGVDISNDGFWWFVGIVVFVIVFCIFYAVVEKVTENDKAPQCSCTEYYVQRGTGTRTKRPEGEHWLGCDYIQWKLRKAERGAKRITETKT